MNILQIPDKIVNTYVLLISTSNLVAKFAESELIHEGITATQHAILMTLITAESPLNLTDLSRRLLRTKNSMTTVIDHMERDVLVVRQPVPGDRRATNIQITDKGKELLEGSIDKSRELVYKSMACLDQDELNKLAELLTKIRDHNIGHIQSK